MTDAYFERTDKDRFVGTDFVRGPWDPDSCHAGPPSGLLARAVEALFGQHRLVRLTVDLDRPIPIGGFRVEAEVIRKGRTVAASSARIVTDDGTVCARATGLHLAPGSSTEVGAAPVSLPTASVAVPDLAEARPGDFPISRSRHGLAGFSTSAEMRYPPGQGPEPGPTAVWMRTVALLADEEPSPFQRICPLADCGNATSRNAEPTEVSFLNPDLTIVLHRDPEGEWLGSDAVSHWHSDGIGLADALLYDHLGPVGRACQTLLLRPTTPPTGTH